MSAGEKNQYLLICDRQHNITESRIHQPWSPRSQLLFLIFLARCYYYLSLHWVRVYWRVDTICFFLRTSGCCCCCRCSVVYIAKVPFIISVGLKKTCRWPYRQCMHAKKDDPSAWLCGQPADHLRVHIPCSGRSQKRNTISLRSQHSTATDHTIPPITFTQHIKF